MSAFDLVVRNGILIDGTGAERQRCDVAIKDGVVAKVAPSIAEDAAEVIDASGLIVAPGVIDVHTHYDAQVHWDPYCTNSSWHGTTSTIIGNCGFGYAPCRPENRDRYMLMMENTEEVPFAAQQAALPWDWESWPEWLRSMQRIDKGINLASFLPLNALMIYVMGLDAAKSRAATPAELQQMKDLLNEAMDAGAIGFAFSYLQNTSGHVDYDGTPMPTDTMHVEDAYALAEVLRERNQGVIQSIVEMPGAVENREVVENLARISGRPVIHNLIMVVDGIPGYWRDIADWLTRLSDEGLEVYSQSVCARAWTEFRVGNYGFWDGVNEVFPEFSNCGDMNDKLEKAQSVEYREKLKAVYTPESMNGFGGPLSTLRLVNMHDHPIYTAFEGKFLADVMAAENKHEVDVLFDIFIATDGLADFATTETASEDADQIAEMLRHPRVIPGASDGGAHMKYWSGGQFSTDMLMWMCKEEK
ncbi:MAG: N-acyl-D-amino-acid deacylase family protein, partial [Alphaproteobacteria bacterium]